LYKRDSYYLDPYSREARHERTSPSEISLKVLGEAGLPVTVLEAISATRLSRFFETSEYVEETALTRITPIRGSFSDPS
jgi:hypothetical protein